MHVEVSMWGFFFFRLSPRVLKIWRVLLILILNAGMPLSAPAYSVLIVTMKCNNTGADNGLLADL